jgi:hypothetical protein
VYHPKEANMRSLKVFAVLAAIFVATASFVLAQEAIATPAPTAVAAAPSYVQPVAGYYRAYVPPRGYYYYPRPRYYTYYPGSSYYYCPDYGYRSGYYPGVRVWARPYGDVGVRVGPRVGVNVWGPNGQVRVGRIVVGW